MDPAKSRFFLLFSFLLAAQIATQAVGLNVRAEENPNPGPRSADEPKFLYEEAQNAVTKRDPKSAIRNLERLIERYPRDENRSRAEELLITLYLGQKNPSAAIRTAKSYLLVDASSEKAQGIRARLVEAYSAAGKNTEARSTAKELLARSKTEATRSRAVFVLARVDASERKWADARAKLDSLPASFPFQDRDSLTLEIGVQECEERHPPQKTKGDDPWIEYFEQKNVCLKALAAAAHDKPPLPANPLWCQAFASLSRSLDASQINSFQKNRLQDELRKTGEIARPLECEGKP